MAIAGILMAISLVLEIFVRSNTWEHTLEVFVVCLDIVPVALFLLITLTYMIAAVRMADSGVLLQNSNSVESISHIDTVCMDKTGTVTTNLLKYESHRSFIDEDEARRLASIFAASTGSRNRTVKVLSDVFGETECELLDEVQFTSKRKYSAVRVNDGGREASLYMGAWSVLEPHCADSATISSLIKEESSKGMRTVVLCKGDGPLRSGDEPVITDLKPVMLVSISDEIRPDCKETIKTFVDNGLDIKVISGDDPSTVDAIFSLAGIPGERKLISGAEMAAMDGKKKEEAILGSNIFGRMRPEDKEEVIDVLVRNGRYVAMIGDGVNDVRSLKSAQVGIALGSGSNAARGVSDMVLMDDSFSALPKAIVHGRRTVSGMRDILKLYLTRNFALALLFVCVYFTIGSVPLIPIQNMFYALLSVSAIAFFMTLFAKPEGSSGLILPKVLKFAIPSAICISVFGILVYAATWIAVGDGTLAPDYEWMASVGGFADADALLAHMSWSGSGWEEICARSAMLLFITLAGVGQIMMVSPYFRFMSVDGGTNKSLLPWFVIGLIALALAAAFIWFPVVLVYLVEMVIFPSWFYGAMAAALVVWFVIERTIHRHGIMDGLADRFEKRYL
jgi:cation-transporting ATPase E